MKKLTFIVVALTLTGCGVIKGHKNTAIDYTIKAMDEIYIEDNIVEEVAEEMIEDVTGLEVDLSPCSPEE